SNLVSTVSTKVVKGAYTLKNLGPAFKAGPKSVKSLNCSAFRTAADHEAVIAVFGNLPPKIFITTECGNRIPDLLVTRVRRRCFCINFIRSLETGFHDGQRERSQLDTVRNQALQRLRIAGIITSRFFHVS